MKTIFSILFVLITFNILPAQVSQEWVARYNGPGTTNDIAYSTAVDNSGNVYITGNQGTVKYNSAGIQQWVSKIGIAKSIVVDNSGNIYVTGSNGNDYLTIKYNSDGDSIWVATYNGPGNSADEAISLVVDNSGNVFVTGYSTGSGSGTDYATIKYNSNGSQLWVSRFNGPGNGSDTATSIALDNSGNIFVTGVSFRGGNGYDFTTLKYNSSGDPIWVTNYNGPGNSSDGAVSIALDNIGNVFVTGNSFGQGTGIDYATIKYNSEGIQQWASRYNGPGNSSDIVKSLKIDNTNNVYITGESVGIGTETDYATIKYNSDGTQQWVTRYNGPGNFNDKAALLEIDVSGNIYVTGESYGIISNYDYATIKYNTQGVQQWVSRYNGSGNLIDKANSITIDNSGNIYTTGSSDGFGTNSDYLTIKYNSEGVQQWIALYNGPGVLNDIATSMVVDGSGNVYVTGYSKGNGTEFDFTTIKYNSSGVEQWVQRYNGPGNSDDLATSIALDGSGNVYVTGYSSGIGTEYDYATVKYNSTGDSIWVKRYNGPGNSSDYAYSILVDDSDNVYVTGSSTGIGTGSDYATIKYNSSGDSVWVKRYNGSGNSDDQPTSIALDGSGNVYVTGSSTGIGIGSDYATIKYNSSGDSVWVKRYNGSGNSADRATSIAVDGSGNVYVTGYSVDIGTFFDYVTIKYNSNGDSIWVKRYNGPENHSADRAFSIAIDGSGNVYVTGYSSGIGTEYDYATVKYNSTGDSIWVKRYNGSGNSSDYAYSILVDDSDNVYVTGNSTGIGMYWFAGKWNFPFLI